MNYAKKNIIRLRDYSRILITETLPYETPIVFSNDGLYDRIKSIDSASSFQKSLLAKLVFDIGDGHKCTQPYLFKVRKDGLEYRRLALLHPGSQWRLKNFYEKYEHLLIHYCSRSTASIRAPKSIATEFYSKSSWENIYQYKKSGAVTSETMQGYAKHTPSFFSYRGHDRLYKFFSSKDFYDLERKFSVQMTLDVSKCFDSIYTHSISWATKEKDFTKNNLQIASFGEDFDKAIRHGNHDETNGIPIGPEISRVFAEIIFQKIDCQVTSSLQKYSFGVDYTLRRYVDDIFIFAKNTSIAKDVFSAYADTLMSFNLHTNAAKTTLRNRPFATKKSTIIFTASREVNDFFSKFLEETGDDSLTPKYVRSPWRVARNFIEVVKSLCSQNEVGYDEVSSFLISAITERIKLLINIPPSTEAALDTANYGKAIEILIDVAFFLYGVAPSVSSSYKISTVIILLKRFTVQHLPGVHEEIFHRMYDLIVDLFINESQNKRSVTVTGFIHLEFLNILLASRELGRDYLIPEHIIQELFLNNQKPSYFTISSCIFYIQDEFQYRDIRKTLLTEIQEQLSDIDDIFFNSEKAHLFLDIIGCPHVPQKLRQKLIRTMSKRLGLGDPTQGDVATFVDEAKALHWQVDWTEIDLLNSLEKKELKRAY